MQLQQKKIKSKMAAVPHIMPLAYRAGVVWFCERPFFVNKNVLIPRFDTEMLVEAVITRTPPARVLDMCTGSGCIAVILAFHGLDVTAADVSRRALRVAKRNAKLNDVHVDFVRGDLFGALRGGAQDAQFDVIVCNPPYVKTADIGRWDQTTLCEPRIALDGGADGLAFYQRIAQGAGEHLRDGGQLFLEIGHEISNDVKNILEKHAWHDIKIVKDTRGLDRVIICTKN